ncbi:non-ribosomal peptide synthetase [Staphylococcus massiliensis]|uniref:non-ribosomal peptide synthetase n=1 Tax=Staphylococcus massiliensis TaxID=555791 RepID=UPI001EDCB953|nr:non-ribosomal peptide synthetase [Staphylococcus massiliensis]MCG3399240.1 amino acid adenylation domain-containing protein [Staphylococcus massiliensis]
MKQLSFAQKEILSIEQYYPNTSINNIAGFIRFQGDYSYERMSESLKYIDKVVNSTRIQITKKDGEFYQYIADFEDYDVPYLDFTDNEEGYNAWLKAFRHENIFGLDQPLYEYYIIKRAENCFEMYIKDHHLIVDGWGVTNFVNIILKKLFNEDYEVERTYDYFDIVDKDLKYKASKRYETDRQYWQNKMDTYEGNSVFSSSKENTVQSIRKKFKLSQEETKQMYDFCEKYGVSPNNLFSSIILLWKSKMSLSSSNSVGMLIHNRNTSAEKQMSGVLSRVLPLVLDIPKEGTVADYLSLIKREAFGLLKHRKFPYENIVELNQGAKGLLDFMVSYQVSQYDEEMATNGITEEWLHMDTSNAPMQLHLSDRSNEDQLTMDYDYNISYLDDTKVTRLHHQIIDILRQMMANPDMNLSDIEFITTESKREILNNFNNTKKDYQRTKNITKLFEQQAYETPDKTAVIYEDTSLTYKELNERANQLSHQLKQDGVKKNDLVALMMSRSIDMIVAIYGVLKADAAYVPIDPNFPEERVNYILSDSDPKALILDKPSDRIQNFKGKIYDTSMDLSDQPTTNLDHEATIDSLSYVIYTSGTTGKPKGVMGHHKGMLNRIQWMIDKYNLNEDTRVLFKTPYTFDVSVWEIFGFSALGGSIVLLPSGYESNPEKITDLIETHDIKMTHFVPSMFNVFLDYIETAKRKDALQSLEYILASGEALKPAYVNKFNDYFGREFKIQLINLYGPTETSIEVVTYDLKNDVTYDTIPIGKPISNVNAFILDGTQLLGIGIPGELCIAGDCVTYGYMNRPELNEQAFVDNPYGDGKMYRTGDLAKWNENGEIEYIGRMDEQVKVRGYRIELGEIENVMRNVKDVKDVAIVAKPMGKSNDLAICGYFTSDKANLDMDDVRRDMFEELPEYMVPAYMMQLDEMPVTANGKLDKKSLPDIEVKSTEYVAPRNDNEQVVATAFEEALNVDKVGVYDNFFEIGGHSLRAITVINLIEAKTGVRLPLKSIFEDATVEKLSKKIDASDGATEDAHIPKAKEQDHYVTSSPQRRLYVLNEMDNETTAYNMPAMFRIKGNVDRVEASFKALIQRHETLRTSFKVVDDTPVQVVHDDVAFQVEVEKDAETKPDTLLNNFVKPFDLSQAPLMRVKVVEVGTDEHIMLFDMHHIVSDGLSLNHIITEFSKVYEGQEVETPELQYKDYSEWMATRDLSDQADYWVSQFDQDIPVLDLPYDYKRPNKQQFKAKTVRQSIPESLRQDIKALTEETKTTDYMVLLSAFMTLLHKYSRQEDIVVGTPVSGRTHHDTESMIGMFVNTLAMRGFPESDKSFSAFLKEMKDTTLSGFEHQEYPLEELIEQVVETREMSRSPLFDVLFTLQNNEQVTFDIDEWQIGDIVQNDTNAKFDLNVTIEEDDGAYDVQFQYAEELFDEATVARMLEHFITILNQVVAQPERQIGALEVVTKNEKAHILEHFNNTDKDFQRERTVIELFEEEAAQSPERLAINDEGTAYTYKDFNDKANQLARVLVEQGVTKGDRVALLLNRDIDMMVSMYATLKVGALYVPIDPNFPEDRVQYILEDSEPKAVLHGDAVETLPDVDVTFLNAKTLDLDGYDTANLDVAHDMEDGMYVIYTSGTTGKPKGVMAHYKGVLNRLQWMHDKYNITEDTKILFKTPYTFDVSVWEIFGALTIGASIVLLPSGYESNPEKITDLIKTNDITMTHFVPSMFNVFLDFVNTTHREDDLASLEFILCSGEALKPAYVNKFNEIIGKRFNIQLLNLYGPTEASIEVITFDCRNDVVYDEIPIGKPIANVQAHILDGEQLVGIGVPGELCIAGDAVTHGYLNRPELNKEKFIDNPFGPGKMYRTGDLAKWNAEGIVEYMGRMDEQVKVRGYRIELGEIENTIRDNEDVNDVAVIAKDLNQNGDKVLCGYITSDQSLDIDTVKHDLYEKLPEYMVPQYMMQIDTLPVTQNGKLNKRALPEIEVAGRKFVAPETENEQVVADAFSKVLGVDDVSLYDNFFEIGGHSLRAISVINEIEAKTGVRLPLKAIFEHATVEQLSKAIVDARQSESYERIPKVPEKAYYKTSSQQKRLYVLNEMEDTTTSYNMPAVFKIKGDMDVDRMEQAFKELIQRHESLRTSFGVIEDNPVQYVHDEVPFELVYTTANEQEDLEDFVRAFDLSKAPLMRAKLVKVNDNEHILMFDMHHIISDGFSLNIIMKDFSSLYHKHNLQPLDIQYKDYSEWMVDRDLADQEAYWLEQFDEEAPVIDLPYDYQRPNKANFNAASVDMVIPEDLKARIDDLTKRTATTDYMVLLSAFMTLLHKYSRQEDIVVGSPVSGRTHKDMEHVVGMFVNTLALRGHPAKDKSFKSFLEEMKQTSLDAVDNQDYPFEELVEKVVESREVSRSPLFDVLFTLQNNEKASFNINEWSIEEMMPEETNAKFDLNMTIEEEAGTYRVNFEYATELFEAETVRDMLEHYITLIEAVTADETTTLGALPVITEDEKSRILNAYNNTAKYYSGNETMVESFEKQAAATPDNVAVTYQGQSYTYQALNERANQIGHTLREQGIGHNDLVGLITTRNFDMIASIYGIHKAGGAYVPIDPNFPEDRIEYILEDSAPKVVISEDAALVPSAYDGHVMNLADLDLSNVSTDNVNNFASLDDLIYVIYTSGTTGKPKGVKAHHRGVLNRLQWMYDAYDMTSDMTQLFKTPFTFDVSVWEIFGWATIGGNVVLLPSGEESNPEHITDLIAEHSITVTHFVPSMFNAFLGYVEATQRENDLTTLQLIIASGEALKPAYVNQFNDLIGKAHNIDLVNLYGPTEASIEVVGYQIDHDKHYAKIPIGKPINNVKAYVLDGDNLVGTGVPGELCISGVCVTYGYMNRPKQTEEVFVKDPYSDNMMYRTGDLVKWNHKGEIEYLGRIDEQVKVRGYRIELGEIENVLRDLDHVQDVAVIAKTMDSNELSLCAYLTGSDDLNLDDIKRALLDRLPEYMVPPYMMQIDALPVTNNGKLDKRALPEIQVQSRQYIEPRNEMETIVAKAFEDVLNIEQVSVQDNFFEIGGHSLKAISVINYIESYTGVRLPLKAIFEEATVEQLSKVIDNYRGNEADKEIPKAEDKPYYRTSSPQKRLFVLDQMEDETTSYNMPAFFKLHGDVDIKRMEDAFKTIVSRHEILRTKFDVVDGEPVQVIQKEAPFELEYEERTQDEDVFENFVRPFNLRQAPLLRVKLIKLDDAEHMLMFDMHHIVSDGLTLNNIIVEFSRIYQGLDLPEIKLQYKDYSEWMLDRDLSEQETYWVNQFSDNVPVLDMPYDYPRPKQQDFKGREVTATIPEYLKQQIKALTQETGTTEYMVLLSAFMTLLHKYSKQEDIVIGSPISGRTHKDTETMLGMFVNTLAMRGYPEQDKSFKTLLSEVKETALSGFEHQEYPFEALVDQVVETRDISRSPLFDVLFTLQNNEKMNLNIDEWSLEEVQAEDKDAKFDLNMTIEDDEYDYLIRFEYAMELFDASTIERLVAHYIQILTAITSNPDQQLKDIQMITPNEETLILETFNNTDKNFSRDKAIIELFEAQVKDSPNETALTHEGQSLTYREFNDKVNQFAHRLSRDGVEKGDFVGLIMNRSIDMMISIYGILKVGAAYVPIDPKFPDERKSYILGDSKPKALIVGSPDLQVDSFDGLTYVLSDIDYSDESTVDLDVSHDIEETMYVIYTSGTTGKPKGVVAHNRGVLNRLQWMHDLYELDSNHVHLFKTPFTFDVSVWEIFGWFLSGGRSVLLTSGNESNPEYITDLIQKENITMTHFVPSMFNAFLDYIEAMERTEDLQSLEFILSSGEALKPAYVNKFNTIIGREYDIKLINLYGPTEASIEVVYYEINNYQTYRSVPIGQPISNVQAYILDGVNLVGIGVPGELCIAGDAVTKGYLNRPELNEEKFIDNPYGEGKMYRTGDLVKWSTEGNIDYLGRIDEQVKVHGYRIELGEIENVMRDLPNIKDVAVIAKEVKEGDLQLFGYVTSDQEVDYKDIRTKLKETLPAYMVPPYMLQIDSMPVTTNGKLDKRALPEIEIEQQNYVAPRSETENVVARTFANVLDLENVGAHDNFFEIGGDSLKGIKAVSEISETHNISIKDIFEHQNVEAISRIIDSRQDDDMKQKLEKMKHLDTSVHEIDYTDDEKQRIEDYKQDAIDSYKDVSDASELTRQNILLTGATGYLGIHIVNELLTHTNHNVHLLIRGRKDKAPKARLLDTWNLYFEKPLKDEDLERLRFVDGNIVSENFGLDVDTYHQLSQDIDSIINVAANVSHFATVADSNSVNVDGVQNIIEFAADTKPKSIHQMSTISVASGNVENEDHIIFSEHDVDYGQDPNNVYIESKLDAEKLLINARDKGLDTNIYRLGNLQCDSTSGIFQANPENNAFYNTISSLVKMKKYPELKYANYDFTCVDLAAQACVKLITNENLHNEVYHIYNNHKLSLNDMMKNYEKANYDVSSMDWPSFLDFVSEHLQDEGYQDEINKFLLHTGMLDDNAQGQTHYDILDFKTNYILSQLDFKWEEVSDDILQKMIDKQDL